MLKYFSFIVIVSASILSCAKEYSYEGGPKPPPADTTGVTDSSIRKDVYVVGYTENQLGGLSRVVYWKNGNMVAVTDSTTTVYAEDIFVTPSKDVYITGYIKLSGSFRACIWKNGVMNLLPVPANSVNSGSRAITVVGSDVYVAGYEVEPTPFGEVSRAVYWKNNQMTALTTGEFAARTYGIAVEGGDVYVCGSEASNLLTQSAKYWKNGVAILLTDGTKESVAQNIAVKDGNIYVSGMESSSVNPGSGSNNQAKLWKNGLPVILGNPNVESVTRGLALSGNSTYIIGLNYSPGAPPYVWKDGTSNSIPGIGTKSLNPFDIAVDGSQVYIAGTLQEVSGGNLTLSGYYLKGDSAVLLQRGNNYVNIRAMFLR
jgi:hypothetical protein